jgi:hypothetical protein
MADDIVINECSSVHLAPNNQENVKNPYQNKEVNIKKSWVN